MKRAIRVVAVLALLAGAAAWLATSTEIQRAGLEPVPVGEPDLANGRTMFFAGDCISCHVSPNQADRMRLGGGKPLPSPYGTFYPPNISPHADGIGNWTAAQFQRAMRGGVSPDGRHYYPAFPYTSYQRMRPADIRDLFAFLKTLPPVEGRIRDHDLPFPFSVRRGLGLWKLAVLDGRLFEPDPRKSEMWNRGAYLVEGAAHCAECHSPRNALGMIVAERRFSGGPNPEGKGWVPNITPDKTGIGDWSKGDIAEVLSSGLTPEGDSVGSNMTEVVRNTSQLPAPDRDAIAEFVTSLPPRVGKKGPS